jgi:FKBP-type peptidyl-prolyl cis-trans isomerase
MEAQARARKRAQLRAAGPEQALLAEAFLDSNRQVAGVQELGSGLQYQVFETGLGAPPIADNQVQVSYIGYLVDGQEFDRSGADPIVVEVSEMLPGLAEALTQMKPGSFWRVVVPPALGYGPQERLPSVPANALLIFDLRLHQIVR